MKSKLPRDILSLVNRTSHRWGIAYAEQAKQQLLEELQHMHANEATLLELKKYLDNSPPCIFATSIKMN